MTLTYHMMRHDRLMTAMARDLAIHSGCRVRDLTVSLHVVPRRWWHSVTLYMDWQREWVGNIA